MRPVTWFSLFLRLSGWWALILGAVCLGATLFSVYDYQLAARFDRDGIMVPVTVSRVWVTTSHTKHGTQRHYHGTLEYSVAGQHFLRDEGLSEAEYYRFTTDPRQQMRILADSPAEVETTLGETLGTAHFVQWVALGFGLGALGLGYWFGQEAAAMVLARRLGQAATVPVIGLVETKRKGKPPLRGRLKWIGPTGTEELSLTHDLTLLRDIPVGSKIEVYIRKGRSFWVQDVGGREGLVHDVPDVQRS